MQVRATIATTSAVRATLHRSARLILAGIAMAALAMTVLSALGILPWLSLSIGLEAGGRLEAGMVAQVGLTTLLGLLVMIIPSNARMRALERSHRNFGVTIADVANAYHSAHAADCTSVFTLSAEFEQMRERLEHLRTHPSLKLLEADMLAMAEPSAASVRAVIQADPSRGETAKVQVDADQVYYDDLASAPVRRDAEHADLQISA